MILVISAQSKSDSLGVYPSQLTAFVETELRLLCMRIEDDVWTCQGASAYGTFISFSSAAKNLALKAGRMIV